MSLAVQKMLLMRWRDRRQVRSVAGFVAAGGAHDRGVELGDVIGKLAAAVAFVAEQDLAAGALAARERWATTMRFWNGPQLLICDELGYLPMPAQAASHLFQVISRR